MVTEGRIGIESRIGLSGLTQQELNFWRHYGLIGHQNPFGIGSGGTFSNTDADEIQVQHQVYSTSNARLLPFGSIAPPRAASSSWVPVTPNATLTLDNSLTLRYGISAVDEENEEYTPESEDSSQSNPYGAGVEYEDEHFMHNHDCDAVVLTSNPGNVTGSGAVNVQAKQINQVTNTTSGKGAETQPGEAIPADVAKEEDEEIPPTFKWVHIEIV